MLAESKSRILFVLQETNKKSTFHTRKRRLLSEVVIEREFFYSVVMCSRD